MNDEKAELVSGEMFSFEFGDWPPIGVFISGRGKKSVVEGKRFREKKLEKNEPIDLFLVLGSRAGGKFSVKFCPESLLLPTKNHTPPPTMTVKIMKKRMVFLGVIRKV